MPTYAEQPRSTPGVTSGLSVTPWPYTTWTLQPHPRIFFGGTKRLARAQATWANPPSNMTALFNAVNNGGSPPVTTGSSEGTYWAFKYLMSCPSGQSTGGNTTFLNNAISACTSEAYAQETDKYSIFALNCAFVYDWCVNANPSGIGTIASNLNTFIGNPTTNLLGLMQGSNSFRAVQMAAGSNGNSGITNAIACLLALEGASGFTSHALELRNIVQHLQLLVDDHASDGSNWAYSMFTTYMVCAFLMYFTAYGQEAQLGNLVQWVGNLPQNNARRLNTSNGSFNANTNPYIGTFDGMPIGVTCQDNGGIDGTMYDIMPWTWEMIADCLNDGVAKWISQQLLAVNNRPNESSATATGNWSYYPQNLDSTWAAFIFNNTNITATTPATAGYTLTRCFRQAGRTNMRGGWNTNNGTGANVGSDINAWFYGNPCWTPDTHDSSPYPGHFSIWRGQDMLFDSAYNYEGAIGTPSALWEQGGSATSVGNFSMCKNGLLISPTSVLTQGNGAVTAAMLDRNGSCTDVFDSTKSINNYPWAAWLSPYGGGTAGQSGSPVVGIGSSGYISPTVSSTSGFQDNGSEACTICELMGTHGGAWKSAQCTAHLRYFSYVRGSASDRGTFVIRDVLTPASPLQRIRWQAFVRSKPSAPGVTVGTAGNFSFAASNDTWTVVRGSSQATIQFISGGGNTVAASNVQIVGGAGFESYFDGANKDFNSNIANTGVTKTCTVARMTGLWRICFDVPVSTKEIVVVITVDASGSTAPDYTYSQLQTTAPLAFGQSGTGPPPPPSVGAFSDYMENAALGWVLGIGTPTRPSQRAVGLSIGVPTDQTASEIGAGSGYARQPVIFAPAEQDGGAPFSASNMGLGGSGIPGLTFGPFSSACTISGFQIWDNTASGSMLAYGTWQSPHAVAVGDLLQVKPGSLIISLA